jgi:IS5 family transposase
MSTTEMMKQTSFADVEFASKKKLTRRERFLSEIDAATPWPVLVAALLPHYPKADGRGRPPIGLERMLRMYIAQQCLGLSDEGIEDAIYDIGSVRNFVGVDLIHESAPDATTLLKFRRLLEENDLTRRVFDEIKAHLASKGLSMREGTIVDATLIAAPSSTKNKDGARDPEMHQSKKGNDWHFGMKCHIGVDMATGLVHTVVGTAGNVSDVTQAHALLHGGEKVALGDAGYQGVAKRPENADKAIAWYTAMRPSVRKTLKKSKLGRATEKLEQAKASVRAKVEHCFHVLKCLFKHRKTRYRGLAKNNAQLFTLFALTNLVLARRFLGTQHTQVAS